VPLHYFDYKQENKTGDRDVNVVSTALTHSNRSWSNF